MDQFSKDKTKRKSAEEKSTKAIKVIGLDLAKNVFQLHGVDAEEKVVWQKQVRRADMHAVFAKLPACLIGMEACATAHYWARELTALGHQVKLIPPSYVKPYVRRGKNDAVDAAAICEATTRPSMRFVAVKTSAQQATLVLHKVRDLLVRERTRLGNALRGHLAEFGFVYKEGCAGLSDARAALKDEQKGLPEEARAALQMLVVQLDSATMQIAALEKKIAAAHKASEQSQRVATIPGIGTLTASLITATIGDATHFKSGRELAAWLGLTPKEHSSGGKTVLGKISKQGNKQIRSLLVLGATGLLRKSYRDKAPSAAWFANIIASKPPRVASVALANKMARMVWAVVAKNTVYQKDYVAHNQRAAA
jgi:transposase